MIEDSHTTSAPLPADYKLRQFGAMLDIHRHRQRKPEIFVVQDSSKSEIAAGGARRFTPAGQERANLFAGGRDTPQEMPSVTLVRELGEEFSETFDRAGLLLIPSEIQVAIKEAVLPVEQLALLPFIVGQIKQQESGIRVDEIAVTTLVVEYDSFSPELQRAFQYLVKNRLAQWIGVDRLAEALELSRLTNDPRVDGLAVRPQLLTVGMLHQLQYVNRVDDDQVAAQVLQWNRSAARRLHGLAKLNGVSVNNGVFTQRGTIRQKLPDIDRIFLGLKG